MSTAKPKHLSWFFEAYHVESKSWVIRACKTKKAAYAMFIEYSCMKEGYDNIAYGWDVNRPVIENIG